MVVRAMLTAVAFIAGASMAMAQGQIVLGASNSVSGGANDTNWCAAWLDLFDGPTKFPAGTKLDISIVGAQKFVLVRLLPQGVPPGNPTILVGGFHQVPQNNVVSVTLDADHNDIVQISVHGCDSAFQQPIPNNPKNANLGSISVVKNN